MAHTGKAFADIVEETGEKRNMSKTDLALEILPGIEKQAAIMRYNRMLEGRVKIDVCVAIARVLDIDLARLVVLAQERVKG